MSEPIKFDTFLSSSSEPAIIEENKTPPIFSPTVQNVTNYKEFDHGSDLTNPSLSSNVTPILFTAVSTVSTLALIYILTNDYNKKRPNHVHASASSRSTPLPGYGTLGDKVNEVIELFLDALAVYVHNDKKFECQRKMLCEANQRAGEYGVAQGVVMYFLSLGVSLLLQNQRVSDSLEAMKVGRRGGDCTQLYPKCPISL